MGVRKTNCRGRLAKSGMTVGSLPQLANVLTIQELQNCKRCTSTNSSSPKKLSYLFGLPLASYRGPPATSLAARHPETLERLQIRLNLRAPAFKKRWKRQSFAKF